MNTVQLIVPDLIPPTELAGDLLSGLKLPALQALLGKGDRISGKADCLETELCLAFGLPEVTGGFPLAAVAAQAEGLPCGGYWLRADPVHFLLQRDKIVLLPVDGFSGEEATTLVESLNQHFHDDGLTFYAPHAQRWYLRSQTIADIETTPLSQVYGRDVRRFMPDGKAALHWHRLTNEIQMLLHQHPLNEVLEARGLRAVNGVWLWGGGAAEAAVAARFQSVCSDEELTRLLARAAGAEACLWTGHWEGPVAGSQLLVYGGLAEALRAGDWNAWRDRIQALERDYAQPLLAALRRGNLSRLEMRIPRIGHTSCTVVVTPASTWKFWRRGDWMHFAG